MGCSIKLNAFLVFLSPLNQLAFIVGIAHYQFVDVDILGKYFFGNKLFGLIIATVEIDGADKGFKNIALDMAGFVYRVGIRLDIPVKPHAEGQLGHKTAVDNARTQLGHKAFVLSRETIV